MTFIISKPWLYGIAIPFVLIVLQVLVDIVTGTLGIGGRAGIFSVGVMVRGILVLIAIALLLKIRALALQMFLFVFLGLFLLSNIVWALSSDVYSFAHELSQGLKVVFPWLLVGIFIFLNQQFTIKTSHLFAFIAWSGFLAASSLLATSVLGMAKYTYGDWSYGTKGLFVAQNDIGLMLVLTLVAAVVLLIRTRSMMYLVMATVIASSGLLLGTRTGVLGPVVVVAAFVAAAVLNLHLFTPSGGKRGWWATAVLVIPVIVALGFGATIFSQSEKTNYLLKRIESLQTETPRSKLEAAGIERLGERGLSFTLLGEGGLAFKKHVAEKLGKIRLKIDPEALSAPGESKRLEYPSHRVENDIVDVLGFYGVAGFVAVYSAFGLVCLLALRRAIFSWNLENVGLLLILLLFMGHSSLAGHGIFSAQVASVIAPVIFLQLRDLKWGQSRNVSFSPAGVAGLQEVPRT